MGTTYADKMMRDGEPVGVWVAVVDGDKAPYLLWVTAKHHEAIEHHCHQTTGRSGVLIQSDGNWRYEVTG